MKEINILAKWDTCGMTSVEYVTFEELGIKCNAVTPITRDKMNRILEEKNMMTFDGAAEDTFYIYFAYHHSSGHKTTISFGADGNLCFEVSQPNGCVFPAFWSEVIIFCVAYPDESVTHRKGEI